MVSSKNKEYFVGLRLSRDEYLRLGAIARRSGKNRSLCIRELIASGEVRERINPEHLPYIRQLIGEATNLNQLAKRANAFGFFNVARQTARLAEQITTIVNRLKQ